MFQIIAYIKFLVNSSNQHGVHSPFVYNLISQCFYDELTNQKPPNLIKRLFRLRKENRPLTTPNNYRPEELKSEVYPLIKAYKKELLDNKDSINVTDFGAGSRVFKSNKREIAKIAKTAGITQKRAELLTRLIAYFNCNSVLELGTSLGIATAAMALKNPDTKITTIEGCPETANIAKLLFQKFELKNITSIVSDFSVFLRENNTLQYDLVYLDGNHQKEATLTYFNQLLVNTTAATVFIFDDIHWSKEMEEAWEIIKMNPKVTLTIDTFFWGFVFFRTENKHQEHFKIRL